VQKAHERFTTELFLKWFNRQHRSQFIVIDEPDPPEAIIQSGKTTRWIEVTAIYWSDAFAQDLNSYVTEGEVHKPIPDGIVSVNSTQAFVGRFVAALAKKLSKNSYVPFRDKYGPGYLIISIQYPFFNNNVMARLGRAWTAAHKVDVGCFRSVYLAHHVFGDENKKITRWSYYSLVRRHVL
jgi:hypothetical protein